MNKWLLFIILFLVIVLGGLWYMSWEIDKHVDRSDNTCPLWLDPPQERCQ